MVDYLVPDSLGEEKYHPLLHSFVEAVKSEGGDVSAGVNVGDNAREKKAAATKRKREEKESKKAKAPLKKKAKRGDTDDDDDNDYAALAKAGALKKFTVPELKAALRSLGLTVGGKKADLIERIEEHFGL